MLHNTYAKDGYDRCQCGCKYWEHDRCIDCGTYIRAALALDVKDAQEDYDRASIPELSAAQEDLRAARKRLAALDSALQKK